MKRKEIKLMIIQNFILHAFSDQEDIDMLNENASLYVEKDHVDEINGLDDQYDFTKINWAELREQKESIILLQHHSVGSIIIKALEGLLSLLDSIQDYAVDVLGYDKNVVFNLSDDDDEEILICPNCGSSDVERKMWVKVNTNEIMGDASDGNDDDNWCNKCETHMGCSHIKTK